MSLKLPYICPRWFDLGTFDSEMHPFTIPLHSKNGIFQYLSLNSWYVVNSLNIKMLSVAIRLLCPSCWAFRPRSGTEERYMLNRCRMEWAFQKWRNPVREVLQGAGTVLTTLRYYQQTIQFQSNKSILRLATRCYYSSTPSPHPLPQAERQ